MSDLLLRGGRPWGSDGKGDVLVRDGLVAQVGPGIDAPAAEVLDVTGLLVLPGLVDAHCHLDKTTFGGQWVRHSAGDALTDRIANERRRRGELGLPDVGRITALLERMVVSGTTHVRSHTDIDPALGLSGVEAVGAAVERLGGRVAVQQVAFPQYGILTNPGTADLLEEALKAGVEVVGGIDPAGLDRDPVRHLDVIFGLAERYGAGVDIHLHDPGSLGVWQLELIAERAVRAGLGGRVAVSHAYGLGQADAATQARVADLLAAAGVVHGTPANMGYMSGALKHFFDTGYYPVLEATVGTPYALYVHGQNGTTGAVRSVEQVTKALKWKAVAPALEVVGEPTKEQLEACRELSGTVAATLLG